MSKKIDDSRIQAVIKKNVKESVGLSEVIRELMDDKDFPNDPVWVARILMLEYDIKPKKKKPES